jgi:hypothetical protein
MRALSFTALAALALAVVSCDAIPVEPPGVDESAANPQFAANQTWVTGSFDVENFFFAECLGEELRFYGEVPFKWHRVFNSSGGYNDLFIAVPASPNVPFMAEGLSSGIVWETRGGADPETSHAGPGEVIRLTIAEAYISRDGINFTAYGGFHITINANGDVTASRDFVFEIRCMGQG